MPSGRLETVGLEEKLRLQDRLKHARELVGSVGALERFLRWETPSEH
jgi:hypothetical protein